MNRWANLVCLFTVAAVLLGMTAALPNSSGRAVNADHWTLATPCCPGDLPEGHERTGTSCGCPCDPLPAVLTEALFPPAAPVARLASTSSVPPSSLGNAPRQPVPIA